MPISVAIVDDHPLAISGIKSMLSGFPQVEVVDCYNNALSLMNGLQQRQPDVLLLDILLPDRSGKELAPEISKVYPNIRIIALTSLDAPSVVKNMMQKGCLGYLLKDTDETTLIAAIEHTYAGEEFIEPSLKEHMIQHMLKPRKKDASMIPDLTQREKEILKLIVSEHTTREIADKLFISFRTVENHRYSLLQKLDVKNTAGLVRIALELGLAD